jgi:hypothetical protein
MNKAYSDSLNAASKKKVWERAATAKIVFDFESREQTVTRSSSF